ncbi:MAG: PIN domain-containing protein [Sulfurovum sp.]
MSLKIYIDTNIFLNAILNRDNNISKKVLSFLEDRGFDIILNDISIINIHYYVQKDYNFDIAKQHIQVILDEYTIISATDRLLSLALNSNFKDFEDAVQYFCAKEYQSDLIITNDKKGFKNSEIETISANDFYFQYVEN